MEIAISNIADKFILRFKRLFMPYYVPAGEVIL